MGSSCSVSSSVQIRVKPRYTLLYSPVTIGCLEHLEQWLTIANKHKDTANFFAVNAFERPLHTVQVIPVVDPRRLPCILVNREPGKPLVQIPFSPEALEAELSALPKYGCQ